MKKHEQITRGLAEIGAAFAETSDRYFCSDAQCPCQESNRRMYHVQPDTRAPYHADVKAFANLGEIEDYIAICKKIEGMSEEESCEHMQSFWDSLDR
jgi:hypothetical protein